VEQLLQHKIKDFIDLQTQYAKEVETYDKKYVKENVFESLEAEDVGVGLDWCLIHEVTR
jgi:hypothetical protein